MSIFVILIIILIYGIPVFLAYKFASYTEPLVNTHFIEPLRVFFSGTPSLLQAFLFGDFGVLSLGSFSFIWAFPVVLLVGVSIAVTEDIRLQRRLIFHSEPLLHKLGLSGRDFIPVLSGYGCNVVAVMQTNGCQSCTQKQCVSMITFGSACSYQIGATLSIFNTANAPWLFLPYLLLLFIAGSIHTRVWYGKEGADPVFFQEHVPLKKPDWKKILIKVNGMLSQFFYQAMPIFLIICFAAFLMDELSVTQYLVSLLQPLLTLLSLPAEAATGIAFSIIRKDGILLLNEGGGAALATFTTVETFVLVYLASTLSGCLVTLWIITKKGGIKFAAALTFKQSLTSILSAGLLLVVLKGILVLLAE